MEKGPDMPDHTAPSPLRSILLALGVVLALALPAWAQDDQSLQTLRRENDDLRQRIAQLEAQLAEAKRSAAECEQQNAALTERVKALEAAATPAPDAPAPPDESPAAKPRTAELPPDDPFVAPEALVRELQARYAAAFGAIPMDTQAQRDRASRDVRRWVRDVQRELRGDVEWLVRIERPNVDERGRDRWDIVVIDPSSGLPYDTQPVPIADPRFVRAINEDKTQKYWRVVGSVRAEPVFNESRWEAGLFDRPRFIGVMVDFGMSPSFRVIEPAQDPTQPAP